MLGVWKPHLLPHVPWTSGKQISDGCERLWAFFLFSLWLEALEEEKPPEPGTLTEAVLTQQEVGSQSGGEGQEQGGGGWGVPGLGLTTVNRRVSTQDQGLPKCLP